MASIYSRHILFCLILFFSIRINTYSQNPEWFTIKKVADNVYVFVTPGPAKDYVQGNSTVIIGTDGIFMVDSFADPFITEKALQQVKKISSKPISFLVNTHWHYDHVMGNYLVKKKFPNVKIIAHKFTSDQIDVQIPAYIKTWPGYAKNNIHFLDSLIKVDASGKEDIFSDYESHVRYPETIKRAKDALSHLNNNFAYVPCDISFSDSLDILFDNDKIRVFFAGDANTKGDAMVYIPSKKILITGDVVVSPVPYAFGSNHSSWMSVLNNISKLDVATYIPGHGEPMNNKAYILSLISLFEKLNAEVKNSLAKEMSLRETVNDIQLADMESQFAGDDEEKKWAFKNYFLFPAIQSVYKELKNNR